MTGIKCEYDAASMAIISRYERIAPDILRRAYGRSANAAKRALFSTIRRHGNQKYGVQKLARRQSITRQLNGGKPSDIFGKFSTDSAYHVAYVRGDTQVIGWADRLHGFLSALQSSEHRDFTAWEVKRMKARLRDTSLPAYYSRPERPVIEPFAASMTTIYPGWVIRNFEKMYNARIARRAS